ncbi:MAG: NAD(P)-dependent oxidoreductase, partial [Pseudomonadota bacterium]
MRNFPLFVNMVGARVVIAGGGEEAAQKARLLCRTEAEIVVMAPHLCDELEARRAAGEITHLPETVRQDALSARLVIAATGCAGADATIATLAREAGALVNVVDRPSLCDVTMPAIVDRDPVVIAIGTEGTAPVLARQVKSKVEAMLEPGLGTFAAFAGRLRAKVAHRIAPDKRRAFWAWIFRWGRARFADGEPELARRAIGSALATGVVPDLVEQRVSIIETVACEADLLTLRAVARLQDADLIIHDANAEPEVLELARRDAAREVLSGEGQAAQIKALAADNPLIAVLVMAPEADDLAGALKTLGL